MLLSIITPTYNRAVCLSNLYKSMLQNNNKEDFEWIIIDDGSIDETQKFVNEWITEKRINIQYIKKSNEGKTNALIDGFSFFLKGEFSVVVDSDDRLVKDAIAFIQKETQNLSENEIGLSVLKSDLKGNLIGSEFRQEKSDYTEIYFGKNKTSGDKLFIVQTEVYKKCLMRSFNGEKLIPESVFYLHMSKYGNFKCINKILYCGNYLEDGLSFNIAKLAAANIEGFIFEKKLLQMQRLVFPEKIKNEVKYIVYSLSGNKNIATIINHSNNKILTGILLFPVYVLMYKKIKNIRNIRRFM